MVAWRTQIIIDGGPTMVAWRTQIIIHGGLAMVVWRIQIMTYSPTIAPRLAANCEEWAQRLCANCEEWAQRLGTNCEEWAQRLGANCEEWAQRLGAKCEECAPRWAPVVNNALHVERQLWKTGPAARGTRQLNGINETPDNLTHPNTLMNYCFRWTSRWDEIDLCQSTTDVKRLQKNANDESNENDKTTLIIPFILKC